MPFASFFDVKGIFYLLKLMRSSGLNFESDLRLPIVFVLLFFYAIMDIAVSGNI